MMKQLFLILFAIVASVSADEAPYADSIRNAQPVIHLGFDQRSSVPVNKIGDADLTAAGPNTDNHPSFPEGNKALNLPGKGARLEISDPGPGSQFDFDKGDPISIEAWVNLSEIGSGQNVYIIGKGRTNNKGFAGNNQNWALRLWELGGAGRPSFLFRSKPNGDHGGDWHRWTAAGGIAPKSGWHHIAVTYTFGDPKSIKCWIDGLTAGGEWDMGGATTEAPVSDDDQIWVGSSMGGSPGSSFRGSLDEVAVYRRAFDDNQIVERYPVEPYAPPEYTVAPGKVRVEIVENAGPIGQWPQRFQEPDPLDVYEREVFGFPVTPKRYDDHGIITDRSNPHLLRATGDVTLPEGPLRLLVRARGAARLWMDGKVIAKIRFFKKGSNAHNQPIDISPQHSPELRYLAAGDEETLIELAGDGKSHRFVYEVILGTGKIRPTLGETSISVSRGPEEEFSLLSATDRTVWLKNESWLAFQQEQFDELRQIDSDRRLLARSGQQEYWDERHKKLVAAAPPATNDSKKIDQILLASWGTSATEASTAIEGKVNYERDIKPILAENCYRCHEEKVKGGLRVDDREALLVGGDSEIAAIVPGDPHMSYLLEVLEPESEDRMPPKGDPLSEADRAILTKWVAEGAVWSTGAPAPAKPTELTSDMEFLRRVTLDLVGRVPSQSEVNAFQADPDRSAVIDRLLADDEGWADRWTGYWQDVLAENPNILKPTLNNTGPFRWWIWESLHDNLPMDRFVTDLVMMRGSKLDGGSAGFEMAAQNDVPMAAKANIVGTAFLGVEMKCARCHDAPYHESTQKDLFELAAMLNRKTLALPESSTVPAASLPTDREPLITISLDAGAKIDPRWPFEFGKEIDVPFRDVGDSRERLAAQVTAPENRRFAEVLVNRMWYQLMGAGFVEPVDDWEAMKPTHPKLLDFLADEFTANGYNLRSLVRLITNSEAYQREARPREPGVAPNFAAPIQRRMSAEQVVDSMFSCSGKPMDSEELTFDSDGVHGMATMTSLGHPRKAWMFTSLSNERDRPSLAIPKAQVIMDVLETFGWRAARQEPQSVRDSDPNVLQPAVIANGAVGRWITTLSDQHDVTELALDEALTLDEFVTAVFERYLTRQPTSEESVLYAELLSEGFGERIVPEEERAEPVSFEQLRTVTWANHLSKDANSIMTELEQRAREGDPATNALRSDWRERVEDMLWALTNSPEFIYLP